MITYWHYIDYFNEAPPGSFPICVLIDSNLDQFKLLLRLYTSSTPFPTYTPPSHPTLIKGHNPRHSLLIHPYATHSKIINIILIDPRACFPGFASKPASARFSWSYPRTRPSALWIFYAPLLSCQGATLFLAFFSLASKRPPSLNFLSLACIL